jgi:hypothetical protein
MHASSTGYMWAGAILGLLGCDTMNAALAQAVLPVPVIYCTDLFHPHDDPDDHFDLATLYAMPELDVKGVVLDQGRKQLQRPGRIPVSQMNHITGRKVPAVIGLADALRSPGDRAMEQAPEFQGGVELILRTLRTSPRPVCIATTGSVRDVVCAFNRDPEAFRTNLMMLLAFIGEASDPGFQEYNVGLDPQAFVGLMRSGLPLYWVPCFDGGVWRNNGHASFWQGPHAALLKHAQPEVLQYFIYGLERDTADPLTFLSRPIELPRRERLFVGTRNLWCGPVLGVMSGREVVLEGEVWTSVLPAGKAGIAVNERKPLFGFSELDIRVNDVGAVSYGKDAGSHKVRRFEVLDSAHYEHGTTEAMAGLLSKLGRAERTPVP